MKYRMYIDEVGNSDLGASDNPNHRYLSLTVTTNIQVDLRITLPNLESLR